MAGQPLGFSFDESSHRAHKPYSYSLAHPCDRPGAREGDTGVALAWLGSPMSQEEALSPVTVPKTRPSGAQQGNAQLLRPTVLRTASMLLLLNKYSH